MLTSLVVFLPGLEYYQYIALTVGFHLHTSELNSVMEMLYHLPSLSCKLSIVCTSSTLVGIDGDM